MSSLFPSSPVIREWSFSACLLCVCVYSPSSFFSSPCCCLAYSTLLFRVEIRFPSFVPIPSSDFLVSLLVSLYSFVMYPLSCPLVSLVVSSASCISYCINLLHLHGNVSQSVKSFFT